MFKKVNRNWGYYRVILSLPFLKIKFLRFNANAKLSLQEHRYRNELWVRLSGSGLAYLEGNFISVPRFLYIAKNKIHSLIGDWKGASFIEIQFGPKVLESDIKRYS